VVAGSRVGVGKPGGFGPRLPPDQDIICLVLEQFLIHDQLPASGEAVYNVLQRRQLCKDGN